MMKTDQEIPLADVVEKGEALSTDETAGEPVYYNKISAWLMVLFAGLAIGSDG